MLWAYFYYFRWLLYPFFVLVLFVVALVTMDRAERARLMAAGAGFRIATIALLAVAVKTAGMILSTGVTDAGGAPVFGFLGAVAGLFIVAWLGRKFLDWFLDDEGPVPNYWDAPRGIVKSMNRIDRSARSLKGERPAVQGLIDTQELRRLVDSATEQANLSSELNASIKALRKSTDPADRHAVDEAEQQIKAIGLHLKDVELKLNESLASTRDISAAMTAPELERQRQRAAEEAAAEDELRYQQARERMARATDQSHPPTPDEAISFQEKVTGLQMGYAEVHKISEESLNGSTSPKPPQESDNDPAEIAAEAKEIARQAARWAGKASLSAARWGLQKLNDRAARLDDETGLRKPPNDEPPGR